MEADKVDRSLWLLLKHELVAVHVPVVNGSGQRLFEDHLSAALPDLKQIRLVLVQLFDLIINNSNEQGAEVCTLCVQVACFELVQLAQWDFKFDEFSVLAQALHVV